MLKGMGLTYKFYQRLFWGLCAVIVVTPIIYWASGLGQNAGSLSAAVLRQPDGSLLNSPKAEAFHNLLRPLRLQSFLIYPLLLLTFQLSGGAVALRERVDKGVALFLASSSLVHQGVNKSPVICSPGIAKSLALCTQDGDAKRAIPFEQKLGSYLRLNVLVRLQSHLSRFGRFIPSWGRQLTGQRLGVTLGFVIVFNLALALLYLPLSFYRGFVVAHQFGLSTQAMSGWLRDWGVNLLLGTALNGVMFGGFYSMLHLFPRRWPLPAGLLLVLFSFIFSLLAPLLITPLFYEVRPLADPILRERILALAERANMPVDNIYVIDASSKTTQVNAYVTSFGQTQRMVLYDTLLEGYPLDQVEVVVAHELGHWYYQHLLWGTVAASAAGWLGLFPLHWLLARSWQPLGLKSAADVAGLPYLLALLAIVTSLSLPFQNGISRYAEGQADAFALTTSQNPTATITFFEQLAEQNLSLVKPPTWEVFLFYTHPPLAARIQRAENFQTQQQPQ